MAKGLRIPFYRANGPHSIIPLAPALSRLLPLVNGQLGFSQQMTAHIESTEANVQQLANLRPEDVPRLGLNASNLAALEGAFKISSTNLYHTRESIGVMSVLNSLTPAVIVRSTVQRAFLSTGLISTSRNMKYTFLSFHVSVILTCKSL